MPAHCETPDPSAHCTPQQLQFSLAPSLQRHQPPCNKTPREGGTSTMPRASLRRSRRLRRRATARQPQSLPRLAARLPRLLSCCCRARSSSPPCSIAVGSCHPPRSLVGGAPARCATDQAPARCATALEQTSRRVLWPRHNLDAHGSAASNQRPADGLQRHVRAVPLPKQGGRGQSEVMLWLGARHNIGAQGQSRGGGAERHARSAAAAACRCHAASPIHPSHTRTRKPDTPA